MKRLQRGAAVLALLALAFVTVTGWVAKASETSPKWDLPSLSERIKVHETLRLLAQLGYAAVVDPTMKVDIEGAIRGFQRDHNLPVDGKVTEVLLVTLRDAKR